jgi:hypothetical protein
MDLTEVMTTTFAARDFTNEPVDEIATIDHADGPPITT